MVGILIAAAGIIIAAVYNTLNIIQNTRVHRYEVLKNPYDKFHNIQKNTTDGTKYQMEIINLATFMQEIIDLKIIPKDFVLTQMKGVFMEVLWIANHTPDFGNDIDNRSFFEFYKKNNIQEKIPSEWTLIS